MSHSSWADPQYKPEVGVIGHPRAAHQDVKARRNGPRGRYGTGISGDPGSPDDRGVFKVVGDLTEGLVLVEPDELKPTTFRALVVVDDLDFSRRQDAGSLIGALLAVEGQLEKAGVATGDLRAVAGDEYESHSNDDHESRRRANQ